MNQTLRQRIRQELILLPLLFSTLVIAPGQHTQPNSDQLAAGLAAGDQASREVRRRRPDDTLPWLDDGQDLATAAGLAQAYAIDISAVGGILPDWIPTSDPILLAAYIQLFKHTTPIYYGLNGRYQTSGLALARFIAENEVRIVWEDKSIFNCGPTAKGCVDRNHPDPAIAASIFIADIGFRPANLVDLYASRIAHEAFHLTFPYGKANSQMEERDAKRIEAIILGCHLPDAYETPDYRAEAIEQWAAGHCSQIYGVCAYDHLPLYPNPALKDLIMAGLQAEQ
jgi:hypothetical protein